MAVPAWVQARALGAYQMIFAGGMALGSVIWGFIAEHVSTSKSLMCAAAGLAITLPFSLRFHVLRGVQPDLSPHRYMIPIPELASERDDSAGPVRVSIDYFIDPSDYAAFTKAVHQLRDVRLRDGAIRWAVYQDALDPGKMNETFVTESWLEYLRQRERFTASDRHVRDLVLSFHRAKEPPRISHMFYAKEVSDPPSNPDQLHTG
jgi:quinol monooxygenase YgiN